MRIKKSNKIYNCIIIGSGGGGLTAGIYCGNAGMKDVTLMTGSQPGGLISITEHVANYTGFKYIEGNVLAEKALDQAKQYVDIVYASATEIIDDGDTILVVSDNGITYRSRFIIFATGSSHVHLGIPGEVEFANKGLSYCSICDGFLFKDKTVLVIGSGDKAVEDVIYMSNIAKKVMIAIRGETFKAKPINTEKMLTLPNVEIIRNHSSVEIIGTEELEAVKFVSRKGDPLVVPCDGLFVSVGQHPNSRLIENLVTTEDNNYIIVDSRGKTSNDKIYAVGDVVYRSHPFKQYCITCGEGCVAALSISEQIN